MPGLLEILIVVAIAAMVIGAGAVALLLASRRV
jgi:hypothetical protein